MEGELKHTDVDFPGGLQKGTGRSGFSRVEHKPYKDLKTLSVQGYIPGEGGTYILHVMIKEGARGCRGDGCRERMSTPLAQSSPAPPAHLRGRLVSQVPYELLSYDAVVGLDSRVHDGGWQPLPQLSGLLPGWRGAVQV